MIADTWHIELLGRCRVTCGKEFIDRFRTQKTGALLAYLALYSPRRIVTREELASIFWAESDSAQADHSLRQSLSWLRSRLEPGDTPLGSVLSAPARTGIVMLQPGTFACDVSQFESLLKDAAKSDPSSVKRGELLRRALALYRGDLLPGVYDDWAQTERERLIALRDRAEHELTNNPSYAVNEKDISLVSTSNEGRRSSRVPNPINRFWGREDEIASMTERLSNGHHRLLTVTAPGGFGKTRLAVEFARKTATSFPGGVIWVSLADLPVSTRLSDVLEVALNMPPVAGKGDGIKRIGTAFNRRGGRLLLVVDNAETLLSGGESSVATEISRLMEVASDMVCLVTSRVPLGIAGETEVALAPLPVNTDQELSPSVSLLVDRVQAIRQDFALTNRNRSSIHALCERLGGIPLALELVAARLRTMSPQTLLSEIAAPLDLWENVGEERRGRPERHRRLRVALEGSFSALSPQAQEAVAALTVFQNGWSTRAARALLGTGASSVLQEIASLAWSVPSGEERWSLPVPLKEFAAEQLSPEARANFLSLHASHFASMAREAFENRHTSAQIEWLANLSAERENLRLALTTLTQTAPVDALRMAADLAWFWRRRGEWEIARQQLCDLMNNGEIESVGIETQVEGLIGIADLCWSLGRPDDAEATFRKAQSMATEESASMEVRMRSAERLGRFLVENGRWRTGEPFLTEAYDWYNKIGNRRGAGKCLSGIALAAHYAENYSLARKLVRDALREVTSVGDRLEQTALIHQSGWCGAPEENNEERIARCETLLSLAEETGDTLLRATALLELGEAYRLSGDLQTSYERLIEGRGIVRSVGAIMEEALLRNQEGVTLRLLGRLTESEAAHRDALALVLHVSQHAFGPRVRIVLADFAILLRTQKQIVAAVRIHGAIMAWSEQNGLPITPYAQSLYSSEQVELRKSLGESAFEEAWQVGANAQSVDELM